jgi:hypothetical protein
MKSFARRQNSRPVPRYTARPEVSRRAAKRAALRHQIFWAQFGATPVAAYYLAT